MEAGKYNYTHFGTAITGSEFRANVPENWEEELNEFDEYNWGGYKAVKLDIETEETVNDEEDDDPSYTSGYNYACGCVV